MSTFKVQKGSLMKDLKCCTLKRVWKNYLIKDIIVCTVMVQKGTLIKGLKGFRIKARKDLSSKVKKIIRSKLKKVQNNVQRASLIKNLEDCTIKLWKSHQLNDQPSLK